MPALGAFGQGFSGNDASTSIEKGTPWVAASDGNLELVKCSLKALNMSPNAPDQNGYTLVHAAAAYNQINILEWLMTLKSVDVNAQDTDGDTPLHHTEHLEAAKFLIENMNANPTISNADEKTAFQVRDEELREQMEDEDDDDNEELLELVAYLRAATTASQGVD